MSFWLDLRRRRVNLPTPRQIRWSAAQRDGRHLGMLKALQTASHPASLSRNPPRMLDLMSTTDEIAYIPSCLGIRTTRDPGSDQH